MSNFYNIETNKQEFAAQSINTPSLNVCDNEYFVFYKFPDEKPEHEEGSVMVFNEDGNAVFVSVDTLGGGGVPNAMVNYNGIEEQIDGAVIVGVNDGNNKIQQNNDLNIGIEQITARIPINYNNLYVLPTTAPIDNVTSGVHSDADGNLTWDRITTTPNAMINNQGLIPLTQGGVIIGKSGGNNQTVQTNNFMVNNSEVISKLPINYNNIYKLPTTAPPINVPTCVKSDNNGNLSFEAISSGSIVYPDCYTWFPASQLNFASNLIVDPLQMFNVRTSPTTPIPPLAFTFLATAGNYYCRFLGVSDPSFAGINFFLNLELITMVSFNGTASKNYLGGGGPIIVSLVDGLNQVNLTPNGNASLTSISFNLIR